MEIRKINGFGGTMPPCVEFIDKRTIKVNNEKCIKSTFQVFRDTPHYFVLDTPFKLRKRLLTTISPTNYNTLPSKCHYCKDSKYQICNHGKYIVLESVSGKEKKYEFICNECNLRFETRCGNIGKYRVFVQKTRRKFGCYVFQ